MGFSIKGALGTVGGLFTGQTEGKIIGGISNGFANAAGTPNTFQATPYGQTAGGYTNPDGSPASVHDILMNPTGVAYHAPGTDPNVAAAFNYQDPNAQAYTQGAQGAQNQGAQAYQQQQGVANQQGGLAQLLTQSANGQGPSVAQLQLNQGLDQSRRQASSIAQGAIAQGVNPALAFSMANNAGASNAQQASNDAATQRVNEQLAGRQQLGSLLGQMSGVNLQQQNLSGNQALNYYGMGQQGQQFGTQTQMSLQDLLSGNYNQAQQINSGVAASNSAQHAQLSGQLLGGAGALAMKAAG